MAKVIGRFGYLEEVGAEVTAPGIVTVTFRLRRHFWLWPTFWRDLLIRWRHR